ncbi:MAG: DNA starvation/stationary phase protection protein Dps [Myxococcota bacterium]
MRMFPSHVRLGTETRHEMCQLLNTSLAATLDLTYQVKQAHWNIKGPQFFARHELFDKLADRVRGFSDDIAERVSTLGGYARGTVRMSAEGSPLAEYDSDAVQGKAHIRTLVDRYGHLCGLLREQIGTVQKLDDVATEDLLTEVVRELELDMWFLESHLNVEPEN